MKTLSFFQSYYYRKVLSVVAICFLFSSAPGQDLLNQANKLQQTNDNAAALASLRRYGSELESSHKKTCDSIATQLNVAFSKVSLDQVEKEKVYNQRISLLRSESEDIERENFKLIRSTLFMFGLLTGIIVLVLLSRFRTLHKLKRSLLFTESRINRLKSVTQESDSLMQSLQKAKKLNIK